MIRTTTSRLLQRTAATLSAVLICWMATTGCSAPQQGPRLSGFVKNPPQLVQSPKVPTAHVWVHPTKRISEYYKYIIDPVVVTASPNERDKVQAVDLQALGDYFRKQMISKLSESGKYELVNTPGEGVLRVRTAITGVSPNRPGVNVIPMARSTGIGLGNTTMEGEFIDTGDGERIGVFTDHQVANRFSLATTSKWGSAEEIMTHWAQLLREAADNRWISSDR